MDNMLWKGNVLDLTDQSPSTNAIRDLNNKLYDDQRIEISLIAIGDGFDNDIKEMTIRVIF